MTKDEVTLTVIIPRDMDQQIKDICTRSLVRDIDQLQHIFGCVWRTSEAKILDNGDLEVILVLNAYDKR